MIEHKGKRILFIVQHRFNRSPGQRYRCEQYIKHLEEAGFTCTYSPIIATAAEDRALYSSGLLGKAGVFLKGFYRRVKDVVRARRYDIVFIYREVFMTGGVFFEKAIRRSGAKIIFDFDDAIWLETISEANKALQWLKRPEKVSGIMALSDLVIAGNAYLAAYAQRHNNNVVVFPSTVDLAYYNQQEARKSDDNSITIGWSGSHTTIEHFEMIVPVLKRLKAKYGDKIRFVVYGDAQYKNEALKINGTPWSDKTEVETIASFDIGIMPLPDNEWSKGKCSMKGLQYMGLRVPAVLASVGMNKEVIQDGVNGLLAANEDEWYNKLTLLIENAELRKRLGEEGRKTVELNYSSQVLKNRYVEIFKRIAG